MPLMPSLSVHVPAAAGMRMVEVFVKDAPGFHATFKEAHPGVKRSHPHAGVHEHHHITHHHAHHPHRGNHRHRRRRRHNAAAALTVNVHAALPHNHHGVNAQGNRY